MNSENLNCQNCKKNYIIKPENISFYQKIKVPTPTFCPECRLIQILIWRNQRTLYKRNCSKTGESIISIYDKDAVFPVYKNDIWKSDIWDPYSYAKDFDFDKPFFTQFRELFNVVPRIALTHIGNVINSDYSNVVFDSKNVYLSSSVLNSENISYSSNIDYSKYILDSDNLVKAEDCYESLNSEQCFNCAFIYDSKSCLDSSYLFDCVNCSSCLLCTNQRNKSYMIENVQYSKEEYLDKIKEINFNSYYVRQSLFKKFVDLKNKAIHKYNRNRACTNVTGDTTEGSSNCENVYLTYDSENIRNAIRVVKSKDVQDVYGVGPNGSMLYQDLTCSLNTVDTKFSINISGSRDILYSNYCSNSHDLFGCIGLKNASYCILNKQYSKEEYGELVSEILKQMDTLPYIDVLGRIYKYGDFFPFELSPFKYNETVALEYRLIDSNMSESLGYGWKHRVKNNNKASIISTDLPDIDFPDNITTSTILCEEKSFLCSESYRITEADVLFYKKHKLPLPHACPMCRMFFRMKLQYPYQLQNRKCMCDNLKHSSHTGDNCENIFETTYSNENPAIVYCEKCYQQEIY